MSTHGDVKLSSTLTCPHCETTTLETMPTDACQFSMIAPRAANCCVRNPATAASSAPMAT